MLSYIWNGGIYTGSDKVGISSNSGYSVPVEYMGNQIESRIKGAMSAGEHALWGYANYFQLSKFYCF